MTNPATVSFAATAVTVICLAVLIVRYRKARNDTIYIGILAILGSALFMEGYRYFAAKEETCVIEGAWVRFYDTPEMCSVEVVDRLSATAPVNVNTNEAAPAATEDGFQ